MSKPVLDILKALSFLTKDNQVVSLDAIPESDLRSRLNYYHASRKESAPSEAQALIKRDLRNSMLVSSISARNNVPGVTPKLLLCDNIIIDDALFWFAAPETEPQRSHALMSGFPPKDEIDRDKLKRILTKLAGLPYLSRLALSTPFLTAYGRDHRTAFQSTIPRIVFVALCQSRYTILFIVRLT
jgi:hypothetical protein